MRPFTSATLVLLLAGGGLAPVVGDAQNYPSQNYPGQYAPGPYGPGPYGADPNGPGPYAAGSSDTRVDFPPPPLPEYDQPPCPGYGYIWTPGYWAWSNYDGDYYWVPGTWILPPQVGYLWTPAYWAFDGGDYVFIPGYWGPSVGFYGGIDYGFGYDGFGYEGGYWRGRDFFYNRMANNLRGGRFGYVYDRPLAHGGDFNRASFNGGQGGVRARPTDQDRAAFRQARLPPTPDQMRQARTARGEPSLRAGFNHGAPPIAATARPNDLRGPGVVGAIRGGGPYPPGPGRSGPAFAPPRPDQRPPDGGAYRQGPGGYERRPQDSQPLQGQPYRDQPPAGGAAYYQPRPSSGGPFGAPGYQRPIAPPSAPPAGPPRDAAPAFAPPLPQPPAGGGIPAAPVAQPRPSGAQGFGAQPNRTEGAARMQPREEPRREPNGAPPQDDRREHP